MATTTTTSPKLTNSSTSLPSHLNYCSSSSSSSSSFIALSKLVPGTDGSFWHQLQQQLTPFHSKFIGDQTDGKENSYSLTFGTPQLQAISILFHHFIESNPFELNALLKKNEIEYETKLESLHRQFEDTTNQFKTISLENKKLKSETQSLQETLTKKETQWISILEEKNKLNELLLENKSEIVTLQLEKKELLQLQGHHSQLDSLQQEEFLKISKKYTDLRSELDVLRSEASESKVEVITLKYENDRLEQQLKVAQQHLQWYEQHYQDTCTEHLQQEHFKNEKIQSLLHQLDQLTQEKSRLDTSFQQTLTLHDQVHQQYKDTQIEVVNLKSELHTQAVQFQHELKLHQDLAEKHQVLAKEAKTYAESMALHVAEAKAAYLKLQQQSKLDQTHFESSLLQLQTKYTQLETKYQTFVKYLCGKNPSDHENLLDTENEKDENDLQFDIHTSSPETLHLLASSFTHMKAQWSGKSYTELFETLLTKESNYMNLKQRHDELKGTLQSVLEELETRAPYYQHVLQENEELKRYKKQAQHDWLELEKQKVQVTHQLQSLQNSHDTLQGSLDQLKTQASFLAQQLIHLLSGMNVDTLLEQLSSTFLHTAPTTSSSSLVASYIVFDDVETLVKQHQALLLKCSELEKKVLENHLELKTSLASSPPEEKEEENEKEKKKEEKDIDETEKASSMVVLQKKDITVNEPLLSQAVEQAPLPTTLQHDEMDTPPSSNTSSVSPAAATPRLKHLESVVVTLETQLKDQNLLLLGKEQRLVQLEAKCQTLTLEHQHTISQLTTLKEENKVLLTKSNTYVVSLARWEEKHHQVVLEFHQLQKTHESCKQQLLSMTLEKNILEKSYEQVLTQVTQLSIEKDMYLNLSKETQLRLQQVQEQAHLDKVTWESKLKDVESFTLTLTHRLDEAHVQETFLLTKHVKDIENLQKEWLQKFQSFQPSKPLSSPTFTTAPPSSLALKIKVSEPHGMEEDTSCVQANDHDHDNKEEKVGHVKNLSNIQTTSTEPQRLKLENDLAFATEELQQKEKRLQELIKYSKDIEDQLERLEKEKEIWKLDEDRFQSRVKELTDSIQHLEHQNAMWESRHQSLETQLNEQTTKYQTLQRDHDECETKWRALQSEVQEANENYLREFQLHAKDVQALESLKHQLDEVKAQLQESQLQKHSLEQDRQRLMKSYEANVESLQSQVHRLTSLTDNLRQQNDQLYAQVHPEGKKPLVSEARQQPEEEKEEKGDVAHTTKEHEGNFEKVTDSQVLIDLLRKERDVLLLEQETTLLAHARQLAQQERMIEHLKTLPSISPESVQLKEQLHLIQKTLEREQQKVQLLRESNTTLRQERQHFEHMSQVRQASLETLESDMAKSHSQVAEWQAQVQSLQVQVERYTNEAQEWRHKYTHLFQKYETIDPEQHLALQTQVQELTSQVQELQMELEESKKKYQDTVIKANANLLKFRENLVKSKEELKQKVEAYSKLEVQSQLDLKTFQTQLQECQSQLSEKEALMEMKDMDLKKLHEAFEKKKLEVGGLKNQLISFKMKIGSLAPPLQPSSSTSTPTPTPPPPPTSSSPSPVETTPTPSSSSIPITTLTTPVLLPPSTSSSMSHEPINKIEIPASSPSTTTTMPVTASSASSTPDHIKNVIQPPPSTMASMPPAPLPLLNKLNVNHTHPITITSAPLPTVLTSDLQKNIQGSLPAQSELTASSTSATKTTTITTTSPPPPLQQTIPSLPSTSSSPLRSMPEPISTVSVHSSIPRLEETPPSSFPLPSSTSSLQPTVPILISSVVSPKANIVQAHPPTQSLPIPPPAPPVLSPASSPSSSQASTYHPNTSTTPFSSSGTKRSLDDAHDSALTHVVYQVEGKRARNESLPSSSTSPPPLLQDTASSQVSVMTTSSIHLETHSTTPSVPWTPSLSSKPSDTAPTAFPSSTTAPSALIPVNTLILSVPSTHQKRVSHPIDEAPLKASAQDCASELENGEVEEVIEVVEKVEVQEAESPEEEEEGQVDMKKSVNDLLPSTMSSSYELTAPPIPLTSSSSSSSPPPSFQPSISSHTFPSLPPMTTLVSSVTSIPPSMPPTTTPEGVGSLTPVPTPTSIPTPIPVPVPVSAPTPTTTTPGFEFKPIEFTPQPTTPHSKPIADPPSTTAPTPRSARLRQRGALPTVPVRRSGAPASHLPKKP